MNDSFTTGDISGSIAAIGSGAQVIINRIERALTDPEVTRQVEELDRERLSKAVATYVGRLRDKAQQAQDRPAQGNPYKGLLQYDIDDAALFYGRSAATRAVFNCLGRGPLTVLHAESGAGKTSLIKAGIVPRLLADGHVPLYVRPRKAFVPGAIKQTLMAQSELTPSLIAAPLYDFVRWIVLMLMGQQLVVILDQFEEVFWEQSQAARTEFVEQLAPCLDDSLLPVQWIIALRADQVSQLSTFRPQVKQPLANEYLLQPFTRTDAREIIIVPAQQRNVEYESGLVDKIIGELDQPGISPSQLQLVCSTLFDKLDGQTRITHVMYDDANGAKGILGSYLDIVLKRDVVPEQRQAAQSLLQALIMNKRRVPRTRDELVRYMAMQSINEATVAALLSQLVESRLLEVEQQAALTYELVHDYLAEKIEIDPAAQARKIAQESLGRAMEDYQQTGSLIGADRLELIETQGRSLNLEADYLDLLFRSTLAAGRPRQAWQEYASLHHQTGALANRWAAELEQDAKADAAIQLLVSLSDAQVVSRLKAVIESHAPADQTSPLHYSPPVQRRALMALAQMECGEAKVYLEQLTPGGFCFVPAGSFVTDNVQVWLPSFWMASAPVTVDDWQQFTDAGAYEQVEYWLESAGTRAKAIPAGWQRQRSQTHHPVRNLTWYAAMAFAAWSNKTHGLPVQLPSEFEWEKAAAWDHSNGQVRRFPWGDEPDSKRCNVRESGEAGTTPIGRYSPAGDSPCGAQDMAGNVLEWTCTQVHAGEPENGLRVLRGGAFNLPIEEARCASRHLLDAAMSLSNTGCRICLRLVPLTCGPEPRLSANDPAQG